ncbi:hypothetical protein CAC42_6197 [Sphaceloma murrayae]|uniref:Amidase domain-containing protein n=1 Tax=Sphaceloma murrayae TaxID=2082308 RepID=A0A2K1QTV5_9PEZI|nr:hypothetical protein CAC42_6197 [Sphaceloma murrayae]
MPSALAIVQPLSVPAGTEAFEKRRAEIIDTFGKKVPQEYRLPEKLIKEAPKDVTAIPRTCGILTEEELHITDSYDAVELAAIIARRKYTAETVVRAFCKRAIVCHQISCCLTQWFPEEAIERAKQLDEHLQRTGKTVGPLHGVPVSIKEHMPIAGHASSTGFVSTTVHDEKDAQMISILRDLGAVFYVKTNQPQGIMHLESDSHVGRVLNPYNTHLSAGGSTGGEAALIALRGSVLGVGTDIGGSVRGPSGFCGIYGFKPTSYTLPMKDFLLGGFPAELNILCSTGPMCRSLRDVDFFMHNILSAKPHLSDTRLIPIPWSGLASPGCVRQLKVGIMMNDGDIVPQPPVTRALEWARERLAPASNVVVKPYSPYKSAEAVHLIRRMYWPDGGAHVREECAKTGEPIHPLTTHILADAESSTEMTATEISKLRVERDAFRCAFADHWNEQDVDFVLCPMFVGPACMHDTSWHWNYTALWNFVDYPGIVFPTPIKAEQKGIEKYSDDAVLSKADAEVRKLWDEGDFEGAPIALQLVARKYHDNDLIAALGMMKDLLDLP